MRAVDEATLSRCMKNLCHETTPPIAGSNTYKRRVKSRVTGTNTGNSTVVYLNFRKDPDHSRACGNVAQDLIEMPAFLNPAALSLGKDGLEGE